MTRIKSLFAAAVASAIVAVVPAANAQTFHYVGAGSSAQYTMAAIAADQAAINMNTAVYSSNETVAHWDYNNGAQAADNRDSLNRILPELGNIWIVWLTNSGGTVTDIWTDLSVDSTVGVRTFSAVQPGDIQGAYLQLVVGAVAGQNKIGTCASNQDLLWPDNQCDTTLPTAVVNAFGGVATQGTAGQNIGPNINVGLTDIRPEDALYATTRALAALNTTTYSGLGYVGPTTNIGAPIYTDQGTGTVATPIKFALSGGTDPITKKAVATYTTIPIGAAPIVFIYNNAGDASYPIDAVTGVTPHAHETGQVYPLADLFDGTTACTNLNPAFDAYTGSTPASRPITVFLREPLSGTMNTTEFSLFRSDGQDATNLYNSQEVGVTNPTRSPYNPLALACKSGGTRERAIGTGEVVGKLATSGGYGVLNNPGSIGYIFWGFSNAGKFWASGVTGTDYNYLTLDGVDPLGLPASQTGNGNQNLPNCATTTCPATLWSGSNTFPNLRNGTYKAWSIYRWATVPSSDPYGPSAVAQLAQDYVDSDIADFVPFSACPTNDPSCSGSQPTDGLSVYHSHFTQSAAAGNNGSATAANTFNGGNTLGGGTEKGGDEGGEILGPFGITTPNTYGYVEWHNATVVKDGLTVAEVQHKTGPDFTAGASWVGKTITINGTAQVIQGCPVKGVNKCNPTITTLYVLNANSASIETIEVPYSIAVPYSWPAATTPGTLNDKQ
ncbi:MAG: hypothetical protein WBZ11_17705 [Candidatus Sulfotelmatobacter sp.]|jgi:hypothetical protein